MFGLVILYSCYRKYLSPRANVSKQTNVYTCKASFAILQLDLSVSSKSNYEHNLSLKCILAKLVIWNSTREKVCNEIPKLVFNHSKSILNWVKLNLHSFTILRLYIQLHNELGIKIKPY